MSVSVPVTAGSGELPAPAADGAGGYDRRAITYLAAAHGVDDFYQAAVPALVPFFVVAHSLSYQAAAVAVLVSNLLSSLLQPLFGYWADRRRAPWLVWGGMGLAGIGVSLAVLVDSFPLVLAFCGVTGVGIAAFHPEASRATAQASGRRRGAGMSLFALGGNAGFALAPLAVVPLASSYGIRAVGVLIIPALVMMAYLARNAVQWQVVPVGRTHTGPGGGARVPDAWGAFARLTGAVGMRSIVFFGLNTFLPIYWATRFNLTLAAGGVALTVLLVVGVAGTLLGGRAADRFGARAVVVACSCALGPLLWLFLQADDRLVALGLLVPLALALSAPFSVMVVLGQQYLPRHVGTASGVTLGLAVTVGGLAAPFLGRMADQHGVAAALGLLVWTALLAALISLTLSPVPGSRSA
ncbi:MAG: MFS transporter [Gemmatimonadales bacterium]|nr:MFS transporter [Gemmatimonadales bacterium]